jgi:hypothetical protein
VLRRRGLVERRDEEEVSPYPNSSTKMAHEAAGVEAGDRTTAR